MTSRLRQIRVEPLSDQRWSKVERSLFLRLDQEQSAPARAPQGPSPRSGARFWAAAAGVVVAAAAALAIFLGRPAPTVLEQPSRIATGASTSHLALAHLSVDVEPHSAVVVGPETPQGLLIVVDRGGIVCEVAPRPSDAPLIVQAGATRVRVVGTRFSVNRVGESALVKVHQGVVEVSSGGRSFRVTAGERWPTEEKASSPALDPVPPSSAELPAPTEAFEQRTSVPSRRVPPASKPKDAPAAAAHAPEVTPAEPEASKAPEPSRQNIFEQAAALERRDPARAAELYAELESRGDSWAQNALYARARLEASRGNRGEARRLLERYLERFPRGSNAEDARAVLQRLR
jgi:hypothetical protein